MKKYYLAIQVCRKGKRYAFLLPVPGYQNVYAMLQDIPDITCANIYSTKTSATATVKAWNDTFQRNGVFMYDENF